jgi:D-hydroxyproline dehydrogenase subunit alpha
VTQLACSTLVVGGGPAGLAAAAAASGRGDSVLVVDDNAAPGGQIWRGGPASWRDARAIQLYETLQRRPHVRWLGGSRVTGAEHARALLLETPEGSRQVTCERLLLCTGARELLLPFPGWTLPGVTGAGGLQALLKAGMPIAGKRVVVAGSGPLLLAVAQSVREHRGEIAAIVERRGTLGLAWFAGGLALRHRAKLRQALDLRASLRSVRYLHASTVTEAIGARHKSGDMRLHAVAVERGVRSERIACDFLACGYGLTPSLELARLLGVKVQQGRIAVDAVQRTSLDGVWAAGEATGIGGVDKALAEGRIAGLDASGLDVPRADLRLRERALAFARSLDRAFAPDPDLRKLCRPDTLVCRCEDVPASALAQFGAWREAKLVTRCGMGPCQGRVCGTACEFLYGWEAPGVREPLFPVAGANLASVPLGEAVESDSIANAQSLSQKAEIHL